MKNIVSIRDIWLALVLLVIGLLIFFTYHNDNLSSKGKIVIGISAPLTGPTAWWGEYVKNGVDLAMEDFVKEGIASNIELKWEDDQCDSQKGISVVTKLIFVDKVKYILGPLCNQVAEPTESLFENNKVISLSTGLPNHKIAEMGSYHLSFLPEIGYFMKALVDYIHTNNPDVSQTRMAIIRFDDAFGHENYSFFKQYFEQIGGQIVSDQTFPNTSTDARTQLTKIKASNPDSIMLIAYGPGLVTILKEMDQLGVNNIKKYGITAFESPALLKTIPQLVNGTIYPVPTSKNAIQSITNFTSRYEKKYGVKNDVYGANAYDSLKLLVSAIQSCGYDNSDCVLQKLSNVKNYLGANGVLTVDPRGVAQYDSVMIKTVKNTEFVPAN